MSTLFGDEMNEKQGKKSNEWYTPAKYIEAARAVMQGIDLDPASCEMANRTVKAARYYTKQDDGLKKEWSGNIWLNPPFSAQAVWTQKAITEYTRGCAKQIILLLQAATERVWFQPLWEYVLCFSNHQIIFYRPNASPYHIYHGTCFAYLGSHEEAFIRIFASFGRIAKAIDTPKPARAIQHDLWSNESEVA